MTTSGVHASAFQNEQHIKPKAWQIKQFWEDMAVSVIKVLGEHLVDCASYVHHQDQLPYSPLGYVSFPGRNIDGILTGDIYAFDIMKIRAKINPLPVMTLEEQEHIAKLAAKIEDVLAKNLRAEETATGGFAISAIESAEGVSSIGKSLIYQNAALLLIRREVARVPLVFKTKTKGGCAVM